MAGLAAARVVPGYPRNQVLLLLQTPYFADQRRCSPGGLLSHSSPSLRLVSADPRYLILTVARHEAPQRHTPESGLLHGRSQTDPANSFRPDASSVTPPAPQRRRLRPATLLAPPLLDQFA